MGYTNKNGEPNPPFKWNDERRANLTAKLNAVYFHLYGVTMRDDVSYVFSTFGAAGRLRRNQIWPEHRRCHRGRRNQDARSLPLTRPMPRMDECAPKWRAECANQAVGLAWRPRVLWNDLAGKMR